MRVIEQVQNSLYDYLKKSKTVGKHIRRAMSTVMWFTSAESGGEVPRAVRLVARASRGQPRPTQPLNHIQTLRSTARKYLVVEVIN